MKTSASISYRLIAIAAIALMLAACSGAERADRQYMGVRTASWYGPGFHGKRTASGEQYDMHAMTCAHKSLPFGTRLELISLDSGSRAVVTVNDRGPFVGGRDIDLSLAAAKTLGIHEKGVGKVKAYNLGMDRRYAVYIKDGKVPSSAPRGYTGKFTIQVAALLDKDNAIYLKNGLDLNYKDAYVMEKWVDGRRFYRIRVGKFPNEANAVVYAQKLMREGYRDVLVMQYEN